MTESHKADLVSADGGDGREERDEVASTARLLDVSELAYIDRDGLLVADLGIPGCQARVLKYPAGAEIPLHRHSGLSVKLLVRGAIAINSGRDGIGAASQGAVYFCTGIPYRGEVIRESYLLAIDELGSERVVVER